MRAQGEAEVAIDQGETRLVRWVTPHEIAANQLIPLPELARRAGGAGSVAYVSYHSHDLDGRRSDTSPAFTRPPDR